MRKLCLLLAALALATTWTPAAEPQTHKVDLLDGLYSVEIPGDWWVQESENNQGALIAESQTSPNKLIINPPIPGIDNFEQYSELMLADIAKQLGGKVALLGGGLETDDDQTGLQALFAVQIPNAKPMGGLLETVEVGGYTVTMIAVGPADTFADFLPKAEDVMESYELDLDLLDDHHDELEEIGENMLQQLAGSLTN